MVNYSCYVTLDFLHACASLKHPVTVIIRLRLEAALYKPAPPCSGNGRPRKKGQHLPTPQQVIDQPNTPWTPLTLPWYGQLQQPTDVFSATIVWFHFQVA